MKNTLQIRNEYADWLNTMEWDFFATLTTSYTLTVPSARRAAERLHDRLNREAGGCQIFFVAEPFDCKEGNHLHALIYLQNRVLRESNLDFKTIRRAWQVVSKGKDNRIDLKKYNPKRGANRYVVKYLDRKNADWDIL